MVFNMFIVLWGFDFKKELILEWNNFTRLVIVMSFTMHTRVPIMPPLFDNNAYDGHYYTWDGFTSDKLYI